MHVQVTRRFLIFVATTVLSLSTLTLTNAEFAKACMPRPADFGNALLYAGRVLVKDEEVPFPVVDEKNANKVLTPPIQLVDAKDLKIYVLYIETTADYKIASVVYRVEQDGYPPIRVRTKSNISASGIRTRSLAPKPPDQANLYTK